MTRAELEAKVITERTIAAAKVADKAAIAALTAELALLQNEGNLVARANAIVKQTTTDRLNELALACETIVKDMPITSTKTREIRKWRATPMYGFGNDVAKVIGLLTGIQYSAAAHKEHMLSYTGLTESLIESTLEAIGSLPYYNVNTLTMVEGTEMNVELAKELLNLVAQDLAVTLDTTKLNRTTAGIVRQSAKLNAERLELSTLNSLSISTVPMA